MSETTVRRRGHGADGIYLDATSNRYMGTISLGYGPDGKRIRRKVSGTTKQEVRATAPKYGLASSVWTSNVGTAARVSARLDFGCVWINTHIPLVGEMPHGGFKHSGYGKDLSMYGLEDYTRIKHVMHYHGFEG
jgi:Aldehyde dehydrogenase family